MAVTIKQIAEMCNVSRGTVDRVLNHRGRVSEETLQKVNDAVEKLGYKPNTFGKALALQKKKLRIGIILCSDGNEFYDDVIEGLKAAEEEHRDYQIEIVYRYMKGYDVREQLDLLDELKIKARRDEKLRAELLETRKDAQPLSAFCRKCRELGYEIYDMDLITAGEEFYATMRRSTNGGGENSPMLEGEDDFYELFFAGLE